MWYQYSQHSHPLLPALLACLVSPGDVLATVTPVSGIQTNDEAGLEMAFPPLNGLKCRFADHSALSGSVPGVGCGAGGGAKGKLDVSLSSGSLV